MKRNLFFLLFMFCIVLHAGLNAQGKTSIDKATISLAGEWRFQIDSLDQGVQEHWAERILPDKIHLPGSMTSNGKGDDITIDTKWTGGFWNSAWFKDTAYARYRKPGNIKISFWLQPLKYYAGVAWYQKRVHIPQGWKNKYIELFLERCHWETTLYVDGKRMGMQNALGAPHCYGLTNIMPGEHTLTLRIDNRVKDINPGIDAHSITDNTQTNWNGIVGEMSMRSRPAVYISDVQVFPDVDNRKAKVRVTLRNISGKNATCRLQCIAAVSYPKAMRSLPEQNRTLEIDGDSTQVTIDYPMTSIRLWDEFHPNLYTLKVNLSSADGADKRNVSFGMRTISAQGQQLLINGRPLFLRGTLECAIFPKTGFPATDMASWERIFRIAQSYGLNHMRFHSWCPPLAAFEAADRAGFYLSIECSAWANVGDGKPIDQFLYEESNHIVSNFGNHPSFCLMPYGNEPAGKNQVNYLSHFVNYWKAKDSRRLYTSGSGWPSIPENEYNVTPEPRIQHWGEGVKSIINRQAPNSSYDWDSLVPTHTVPTVSHEIGQWCVYPNLKEIPKYTGVLRAKNFEIFRDRLRDHGLLALADSFLLASGKLQVLCYKADIEAALRTPKFGGFQLLDLHDFPGQGTALVGVLDPFWDDKGYVTAKEFSRFCNATVPLVRLPKMIYTNNELLNVPVEIAHFGEAPLKDITPTWNVKDKAGNILFKGILPKTNIPIGNCFKLGTIEQSLSSITRPQKLVLSVRAGKYENTWDLFVYPAVLPRTGPGILVTHQLDNQALQALNNGGKVLLTLKKGSVRPEMGGSVVVGFSSIFWNTSWTNNQPPHTLGILCNPTHPALSAFPTAYHSNWQWWDAMSHSNVIRLDSVAPNLKPIVRVIDDWFTARPLGLVFECKVGKGSLLVSSIDLLSDEENRPEARQLLYSLKIYMSGRNFKPTVKVHPEKIAALCNNNDKL